MDPPPLVAHHVRRWGGTRYLTLLRGINVGGSNLIEMTMMAGDS
jgi:hypothetical protein